MEYLDAKNYDSVVSKGNVVVDFWAEWCGPCRMLGPIFEELSKEVKGVKFAKVNVDENEHISSEAGIRGIPTMVLYKNGKEIDRIVGLLPKEALKSRIEKAFR